MGHDIFIWLGNRVVDILLLSILLFGAYKGVKKGFLLEAFAISAILLAVLGSVKLMEPAVNLGKLWFGSLGNTLPYIIFVLIFVTIYVSVTLLGKGVQHVVKPTSLGTLDKILGAGVGVFKWGLFISAVIWLAELVHLKVPPTYVENSLLFPILKPILPCFIELLTSWFPSIQDWGKEFSEHKEVVTEQS